MKKAYRLILALIVLFTFASGNANAQGSADYGDGMKIKVNEDGSKYVRILGWTQVQTQYTDALASAKNPVDMQLKRMRMMLYSQMNKKFMIFTHFGANGIKPNDGTAANFNLTLLNAWVEYNILNATKENPTSLTLGSGYHYWNGISRMAMASTVNMLTLDLVNPLPNQYNGTGQFGYFLKGNIDKFGFDIAANEPSKPTAPALSAVTTTAKFSGRPTWAYNAYVHYQFGDAESMFLPYRVGSYVGTKSIFNIGAGAYYNPTGSIQKNSNGDIELKDHLILSADIFFDQPIGSDLALTAYGVFYNMNYGKDYVSGTSFGTGNMVYTQAGLLLPKDVIGDLGRLQPYVGFSYKKFDTFKDAGLQYDLGLNWFIEGQQAKISCQYSSIPYVQGSASVPNFGANKGQFTIQAQVAL